VPGPFFKPGHFWALFSRCRFHRRPVCGRLWHKSDIPSPYKVIEATLPTDKLPINAPGPGNSDHSVWLYGKDLEGMDLNFLWGYYSKSGALNPG